MSNQLYDIARTYMLSKGGLSISWDGTATPSDIHMVFVDDQYTFSASHTGMDAVAVAYRHNGTDGDDGVQLQGLTVETNGAADAQNTTMTAVQPFGTDDLGTIKAIILYIKTADGTTAADIPVAYIDQATGLPIRPNSGDIIVSWDPGTNRIFRP